MGTLAPHRQEGSFLPGNPCVDRPTPPASLPLPSAWAGLESPLPTAPLAWCHLKAGDSPQTQLSHPPGSQGPPWLCARPGPAPPAMRTVLGFGSLQAKQRLGGEEARGLGLLMSFVAPWPYCFLHPLLPTPTQERGARCTPTQAPPPQDPPTANIRLWRPCSATQTLTMSKSSDVTPPNFGE